MIKKLSAFVILAAMTLTGFSYAAEARPALEISSVNGRMKYLGSYWTGETNEDGAIAEIVQYNPDNQKMYMVNGSVRSLDIVSIVNPDAYGSLTLDARVDVEALGTANGFPCGDITSVAVNPVLDVVAIATQANAHTETGAVVFLDYDGGYISHFEAGVQPDMVGFSPDYRYIMTANEGEPRDGENDPPGSVTVADLSDVTSREELLELESVQTVGVESFDEKRAELVEKGVLLKPDTAPSLDLEPEYVAFDGGMAYVSLQEANAVASFDLTSKSFTDIRGLGFKDHSIEGNELDLNDDGEILLKTEENALGVYMPDGLAAAVIGGKTYLLTPNEGDARDDWYEDDLLEGSVNGSEDVEYLNNAARDGLDPDKIYLLGARSFSIFDAETMELVFDSGSDFERIVSEEYPELFNTDHAELEQDGRSDRKGPEPEDVKVAEIGGKTYAFIALERVGGLMVYDISDPANAKFYDYINVRNTIDGALDNGSDLGAEGICIIPDSPTGKPMALVANEISGSVTLIELAFEDASEDIAEAVSLGIVPENLQGDYQSEITRAEFSALAVGLYQHLSGTEITPKSGMFSDTEDENVGKLASLGIVSGGSGALFHPNGTMSREMAVTLLYNMAAKLDQALEAASPAFTDAEDISAWARPAVGALQKSGFISGKMFNPKEILTREEGILTIMRFLNLFA